MYEKVFEQAESIFKPMNEILSLNLQVLDKMAARQTELYNELMNDSVEFARDASKPTFDVSEMLALQKSYFESIQDKIASTACSTCDDWASVQGKAGDFFTGTVAETAAQAEKAMKAEKPSAPAKKKAATKSAPKKTAKKSAAKASQAKALEPKADEPKIAASKDSKAEEPAAVENTNS